MPPIPQDPPPEGADDFDGAWKYALGKFFREIIELLFPDIETSIDWSQPVRSLDRELEKIAPEAGPGRRCDTLVGVVLKDGQEAWIPVHVEVQSQRDEGADDFARRMFVYYYLIFHKYQSRVLSLAILADPSPTWRPSAFRSEVLGCRIEYAFRSAKLRDMDAREAELLALDNPLVFLILAQRRAQRSRPDDPRRLEWKWELWRLLAERDYPEDRARELLKLLDWVLNLTRNLDIDFGKRVNQALEEGTMTKTYGVERISRLMGLEEGLEKGREEGLKAGQRSLLSILGARFGDLPPGLSEAVTQLSDLQTVGDLTIKAALAANLDDFAQALEAQRPEK